MFPSHFYAKATLLDPRYKKAAFESNSNVETAQQEVQYEVAELLRNRMLGTNNEYMEVISTGQQTSIQSVFTVSSVSTSSTENENLLDYLQAKVTTIRSETTDTSTAVTLVRQYMDLPYLNLKEDPMQFWKNHFSVLDPLSELALKYACIPATSVPSERIFSKAGQIVSQRRNRLSPKNVNILIFLNKNLEI
ncbi:zinc finger BED domain-containing protein 4-like [Aphis gossypii]|uniref:zinc finger BED domain-containing protein 4-like n=1 Tax=Aphis gossypii TaxID=80765 RepID=UPI0021598F6B|nr:zinc finger BED domain-containing protein 4-like [Aphis gossypii]